MTTALVQQSQRMVAARVDTCNYCPGKIVWAWTRPDGKSAKRTPIDAEPDPYGRVALVWHQPSHRVVAVELTRATARDGYAEQGWQLHQPHRFTCPRRESWSRGPWK